NDLEAPSVRLVPRTTGVAETLERDRHLGDIPVVHDSSGGFEERIPGAVGARDRSTASYSADDPITLHPISVHIEIIAALLVHEGIEVHRHEIVLGRPVAIDAVGPHDRRIA